MIREFNILATTERILESKACSELWILLRAIGDDSPTVDRTGIWGIISARTSLNPINAVEAMRLELLKKNLTITSLLRVMPILRVVPTAVEDIVKVSHELAALIPEGESYRVTVEKRRTRLGSMEIIKPVAEGIDRPVKMREADWVVLIETLGRVTGVSVIHTSSILNIQKERAQLSFQSK